MRHTSKTIIPPPVEVAPIEMLIIDYVNAELTGDDMAELQIGESLGTATDLIEYDPDVIPRVPASDIDYNLL